MNLFPQLTAAEHQRLVQERKAGSFVWQVIHALGSLHLAVILLLTIALACAVATFTESSFSTRIAQHYIYKAPWFIGWLAVLCLNLMCVTLTRWPWQQKHWGFIITHYGIILLLIGAVIGRMAGFEGFMTISTDQPAQGRVLIQESTVQMQSPVSGNIYGTPLPVEAVPPQPKRPRLLAVPETDYKIEINDYAEQVMTRMELEPVSPAIDPALAAAGVQLTLRSAMMQQELPITLSAHNQAQRQHDLFGLAKLEWIEATQSAPVQPKPVRESQMVFSLNPTQPITESSAAPSGWRVELRGGAQARDFEVIARSSVYGEVRWPLVQVLQGAMALPGGQLELKAIGFWPHFVMRSGQPVTLSAEPLNPALLVQIYSAPASTKPSLRLYADSQGQVHYQLLRAGLIQQQGLMPTNAPLVLGWADWQASLTTYLPSAQLVSKVVKVTTDPAREPTGESRPGIRAALLNHQGERGEPQWILSGSSQNLRLGETVVPVGFGLRTLPLPFQVKLEEFTVPRYEGTDTPSNYISRLRFQDPNGNTLEDEAKMNEPAMFPGGLWRSALGLNYKFSQASWNPQNLRETTLQILYDPGWPCKWVGSLMICCGIFTLFYLKPKRAPAKLGNG